MRILKEIFPISFMAKEKDTNTLVRSVVLHAAVILSYFLLSGILGYLFGRVVAWLLGFLGILVGLYGTGGIVLSVLCYCGILK